MVSAWRNRTVPASSSRSVHSRPHSSPLRAPVAAASIVQGLWASLKAVELANLAAPTLAQVIQQAHRGIERVRRTPHLAYSFLRHAGLSVS
jgi:hypothetical protein